MRHIIADNFKNGVTNFTIAICAQLVPNQEKGGSH
jgi:hypothetical protein